jgi:hypothetical protein
MLNIQELVLPGISSHQFLSNTESVTTSSYRFPESITIPSDSALHQLLEFRPIPESHGYRTIPLLHYRQSHRHRIARNWIITRCRIQDRIILEIAIPESDGIPRNSQNWWNWFLGRNWFRNVEHCGIGWLLSGFWTRLTFGRFNEFFYWVLLPGARLFIFVELVDNH